MPVNVVNDIPYRAEDGRIRMVVEIPAGTLEKWQADPWGGDFYHDIKDGVPRIVNFLPYPMNYGFIPQTVLAKERGGDGDPTDIITLAAALPRGWHGPVNVIGAIRFSERGEIDTKIVATVDGGPFSDVAELSEVLMRYPGAIEIIRLWFEGYKGPGSFLFMGYADRAEALAIVEESHRDWEKAGSGSPA
jgi:inorganic pyrophosphatase